MKSKFCARIRKFRACFERLLRLSLRLIEIVLAFMGQADIDFEPTQKIINADLNK